jgi:site-specific recombinase XerD
MSSYLSNLRRRYTSISKECGFNGHISIYTARTTAATILVNKGANLKAVQTALDHSNIAMTSQYIRGVENSVMKETLEML